MLGIYVDYTFQVLPNGSLCMDSVLNAEDLMIKEGDKFTAQIFNGCIILVKDATKPLRSQPHNPTGI